jgi:hypothetical protein
MKLLTTANAEGYTAEAELTPGFMSNGAFLPMNGR